MTITKKHRFFIFFFLSIQLVLAQDFYVSNSNGSDNNSGTFESPFKTINKGISMVSAGGTVYVMERPMSTHSGLPPCRCSTYMVTLLS